MDAVGAPAGAAVGCGLCAVSTWEGASVGVGDAADGAAVGSTEGSAVDDAAGAAVGLPDGTAIGVGLAVGSAAGAAVGEAVGGAVGFCVPLMGPGLLVMDRLSMPKSVVVALGCELAGALGSTAVKTTLSTPAKAAPNSSSCGSAPSCSVTVCLAPGTGEPSRWPVLASSTGLVARPVV